MCSAQLSPDMIAAIVATICVAVVSIEAARVIHEEWRRGRVSVDYVVCRCGGLIHCATPIGSMWRHSVGRGYLVVVASRGGHLLLLARAGCDRNGARGGAGHLGHRCGRVIAGRGVMHAVRNMCHMGLWAEERGRIHWLVTVSVVRVATL